jgi:hypothetical protein
MTQGGEILRIIGSDACEIDNSNYGYELFQYFTPQLYSETNDIWFRSSEPERKLGFTMTNSNCKQNVQVVPGGTVRLIFMVASKFNKSYRYP